MVGERLRVERSGLAIDQCGGDVEQVRIGLSILDLAEERVRLAQLLGVLQRLEEQPVAAGLDRRKILLAAHRELPKPDLARLSQRVADDAVGVLG